MKKLLYLLPILFYSSCEMENIEPEQVNPIQEYQDLFLGEWVFDKVWFDGTLEDDYVNTTGSAHSCRGTSQTGSGCNNRTTHSSGYCHVHRRQKLFGVKLQVTMSNREDALKYLNELGIDVYDFSITKRDTIYYSSHTYRPDEIVVGERRHWDEPIPKEHIVGSWIPKEVIFNGFGSLNVGISELWSIHDYDIKHPKYGYGYERIALTIKTSNWTMQGRELIRQGHYTMFFKRKIK